MKKIATVLALLCVIVVSAQNYNPIINYAFNGTPTYGVKINTNIPFTNGYGMPTLVVEGFNYGEGVSIGLTLNWYVYNNIFFKKSISSSGGYTPEVKLYNENGKVVIFINDKKYFNRFTIRGYELAKGLNDTHFQGWTITDALPTGTHETVMVYKNKFAGTVEVDGNIGIGTEFPSQRLEISNNPTIRNTGVDLDASHYTGSGTSHSFIQFKTPKYKVDNTVGIGGAEIGLADNNGTFYLTRKTNVGSNGEGIVIDKNANVGIGTESPKSKLQVSGGSNDWNESIQGSSVGSIHLSPGNTSDNYGSAITFGGSDHGNGDYADAGIYVRSDASYGTKMYFSTTNSYAAGSKTAMAIDNKGDIGIGTTDTKGFKLGVNGRIAATEVKVATYDNWADFVFEKEYKLPSLEEVENHIKREGHLENIPSAKEVAKNGFYLAEMDAKLLQKIEELTLYTIQQEKEIKKTKEENKNLKLVLKKLEERLSKLEKNQ